MKQIKAEIIAISGGHTIKSRTIYLDDDKDEVLEARELAQTSVRNSHVEETNATDPKATHIIKFSDGNGNKILTIFCKKINVVYGKSAKIESKVKDTITTESFSEKNSNKE